MKSNDLNNTFKTIVRDKYEPLCLSYKVISEEDINLVYLYVKQSYEISKYNAIDYHKNLVKYKVLLINM